MGTTSTCGAGIGGGVCTTACSGRVATHPAATRSSPAQSARPARLITGHLLRQQSVDIACGPRVPSAGPIALLVGSSGNEMVEAVSTLPDVDPSRPKSMGAYCGCQETGRNGVQDWRSGRDHGLAGRGAGLNTGKREFGQSATGETVPLNMTSAFDFHGRSGCIHHQTLH
jgi:hypothetical protein